MNRDTGRVDFFDKNICGETFDNWEFNGGAITDSGIAINSSGYATLVIEDKNIIKASQYCKLVIQLNDITDSSYNYINKISILISEEYSIYNKKRTREVGITPISSEVVSSDIKDNTIFSMMGSDLNKLSIKITNKLNRSIYIKSIGLYRSKDISPGQLSDIQQQTNQMYGLIIPVYNSDPIVPVIGQIWIRGDL